MGVSSSLYHSMTIKSDNIFQAYSNLLSAEGADFLVKKEAKLYWTSFALIF